MAEFVREASRNGRVVARLRCYDGDAGATIVDAQIAPLGGGEVQRRGPYRFTSAHEAFHFIQEATLAFQYLGCSVN